MLEEKNMSSELSYKELQKHMESVLENKNQELSKVKKESDVQIHLEKEKVHAMENNFKKVLKEKE